MKSNAEFIKNIVDNESVKAPLFSVSYLTEIEDHPGRVTHELSNIIYTELDALMAKHLYATQSLRFPAVSVKTGSGVASSGLGPRSVMSLSTVMVWVTMPEMTIESPSTAWPRASVTDV